MTDRPLACQHVNVTFKAKPTLFIQPTVTNVHQRALQSVEDTRRSVFMRTKSATTNKQTKQQQQQQKSQH